ncbi:cupin domain-containing protein [Roseiarcaceae bacterium H3SJ34-1]|uniref:cupin domain-containing protein n=1 Tax=Terripilifer ovatus TaxID=3032367 RepID=UPI003AB97174|nr:cupin domain-containing protein [Roseiarcaceae bacterium H3SJ34-1]
MDDVSLAQLFEHARVVPLWTHTGPTLSREPRASEPVCHWKWQDLQGLGQIVGETVSGAEAERRVLVFANPGLGGLATTGTLNAALQILNPDETAHPHRHSIAAIRLITDHDGGVTTVNGVHCPMNAGDLILTPAWSWHGHFNQTSKRAMWIDVLDAPLVASWDGVFFEHPAEEGRLEPERWTNIQIPQMSKLKYPWEEARQQLLDAPRNADGSREVRYMNPDTQGAVLPTIDCHACMIEADSRTASRRSTASTLIYVRSGQGVSRVGDNEISWAANDIFTVPHWQWVDHIATSAEAFFIKVSNADMLEKLGLLHVEKNNVRQGDHNDRRG